VLLFEKGIIDAWLAFAFKLVSYEAIDQDKDNSGEKASRPYQIPIFCVQGVVFVVRESSDDKFEGDNHEADTEKPAHNGDEVD
jgi:hypothetical protein